MKQVTVRVYGPLNDFLPAHRRQFPWPAHVDGQPSVKDLIESLGGHTTSTVSKSTRYLIAGSDPGSKLGKAETLGIKVISYEGLMDMVRDAER